MLTAIVFFGIGFGIFRLIRRTDGTAILIYIAVGISLLILLTLFFRKSSFVGVSVGSYIVGLISAIKSYK